VVVVVVLAWGVLGLQIWQARQWKRLMQRLPRVRANIRARMREELCLDCCVGEPHACRLMSEEEYTELIDLRLVCG